MITATVLSPADLAALGLLTPELDVSGPFTALARSVIEEPTTISETHVFGTFTE
jgi:hypothetical protein